MRLKRPFLIIAKTNKGKIIPERISYDEKLDMRRSNHFYEIWFSGFGGLDDFFLFPLIKYYMAEREGAIFVEERIMPLSQNELKVTSLNEADRLMRKCIDSQIMDFNKFVKDLNVYCWIGKPKAIELEENLAY